MSQVQKVIAAIANAADYVGDKPFAVSLRQLNEELNNIPSDMHLTILQDAWGKEPVKNDGSLLV